MYLARDFIETAEGLVFAVTLSGIEDGRIIACLRYRPGAGGWTKVGSREAIGLLQERFPQYLHYSPRRDAILQAVPLHRIRRHRRPRERLRELLAQERDDPLIRRLQRLTARLSDCGIATEHLGITGSLLLGCHRPDSDLDLVCYHRDTFHQAREAVRDLTAAGRLQPLSESLWRTTWQRRGRPLDFPTWLWHERRKFNKGAIDGTKFDLMLVEENPAPETGQHWHKAGHLTLQATVIDDADAFATPTRYRLDHPQIPEVLCFTATYMGQARRGERVEIRGRLEISEAGDRRVIVGASREAPGEYVKVMR
ncbi:conserved hypothetical protein [Methylomarinovum tepidoasis]|uniref:Polymerase nucleotidyl transferase domain-containing protein n=2 Tax=Methylomarinovum tepidoasis TaxID=2840183 RepID=A0AAU9C967_9GAMM|nr:conserved hypothetical protein [Methylomarinovum sp. IN45]